MVNVSFKTYGCSNNFSESEAMAGMLEKAGYTISEDNEDVIVFNMCSVKGPSVNACINQIKKITNDSPEKKIVVAGCVPRNIIKTLKEINPQISIVSTHHIDQIKNVVDSTLKNNPQEFSLYDKKVKLGFPKRRKNPIISIVPILSGCNDNCSYCSTVLIKGPTFSYPQERIVEEIRKSVAHGCKEIWLTSQDNGAYMTDKGFVGLPKLLKEIVNVEGFFALRVGMTNPTYLVECVDDFIDAIKHEKLYKFIHLPVQAGSNTVLKKMNRRYTVEQYKEIVNQLKAAIPDMNIATDIICGFPEETDEQFADTLKLVEETRPDSVFISKFQLRAGTKATRMKQVPREIVNERSRKLTKLFEKISLENNKKWMGRECRVLIDEYGKQGHSIGRNHSYKQVVVKEKIALGEMVSVKIVDAGVYHLEGEIIGTRSIIQ